HHGPVRDRREAQRLHRRPREHREVRGSGDRRPGQGEGAPGGGQRPAEGSRGEGAGLMPNVIRVIDFETTGMEPPAEVVEVGYCDLTQEVAGGPWSVGEPVSWLCHAEAIP